MERQLILRCWNTIKKYMDYEGPWLIGSSVTISDSVLMQYTGIDDKNGKPIFEGDIIIQDDRGHEDPGLVLYYADGTSGCYWQVQDKMDRQNGHTGNLEMLGLVGDGWLGSQIEVIGNIHETPELLEK